MAPYAPRLRSGWSAFARRQAAAPRVRRSVLGTALVAVVSLAVTLTGTAPAVAGPSVAEIEAQIDKAWNKLEPIIEKHNAAREDLAKKKKQANALAAKIKPLQLDIDMALAKVGAVAARAYKGDNTSAINAILTTGSPRSLADQLVLLDQFAREQQASVQTVIDLKQKYQKQKEPLDALVAQLSQTEAQLAAKKKQIDVEIDRLQKLRLKAYGSSTSLGSLRPAPCPATYPGGKHGIAVKFACAQIGKPYVWGTAGPNTYDCSGLTMAAWAKAGVSLPHNAARQREVTKRISRSELMPGDLVFYYSDLHHMGMYVGNGWLVHASTTGVPVKMKRVDDGPINSFGRPYF